MSTGQYRVGVGFSDGHSSADGIKQITAGLIDELERLELNTVIDEAARCAAIAQTKYEDACMWAIKAINKGTSRENE